MSSSQETSGAVGDQNGLLLPLARNLNPNGVSLRLGG